MNRVATIAALRFNGADGVFLKTASPKLSTTEFFLCWFRVAVRTFFGISDDMYGARNCAPFSRKISKFNKWKKKIVNKRNKNKPKNEII